LWLILSHKEYVDPDGAVKQYLDNYYRVLEVKHFQAISIFLYKIGE